MDTRERKSTRWSLVLLSIGLAALALAVLSFPLQAAPGQLTPWYNAGIYGGNMVDAIIDPATGWIYATSEGPLYRSTDNGEHWAPLPDPVFGGIAIIRIGDDGALYTNYSPGLLRSVNGGESWVNLVEPGTVGNIRTFSLGSGDVQHVVVGTMHDDSGGGDVHTTFDGGQSWLTAAIEVPAESDVRSVAIDPTDANVVYAINNSFWFPNTPSHIYLSEDGGLQFRKVMTTTIGTQIQAVAVNDLGVAFAVADDGVYRSYNGQDWNAVSSHTGIFIRFDPLDPNIIFIDSARSVNGGDDWEGGWALNSFLALTPDDPNLMFTKSQQGIQRSTDAGLTWQNTVHGIEMVTITGVSSDPADSQILYAATGNGVGRSVNGGKSWEYPLPGLDITAECVAVDPQQEGVVYFGSQGGIISKSTDYGVTWTSTIVHPERRAAVREIAVDPARPNRLYVAAADMPVPEPPSYGGLYRSEDGGTTWFTTTLEGLPVNAVQVAPTPSGTVVYAGTGDYWADTTIGGVYRSDDNGLSWKAVGFQDQVVNALAISPADPQVIYAGLVKTGDNQPLYRSQDGGQTWERLGLVDMNGAEAITIDPNHPETIYFSSGMALYRSLDGGATWLQLSWDWENTGVQIQAILIPFVPPSAVTQLSVQPYADSARLSWVNPSDPDLEGVHVRFMTDTFPTAHMEGISLTTQTALPGESGIYTHTGLIPGAIYYYSAFAFDMDGRYSLPASISATVPLNSMERWTTADQSAAHRPASTAPQRVIYIATSKGLYRSYLEEQWIVYLPMATR